MNQTTRNVLKMAVMFAVIGAVMAVAMPAVTTGLGFTATAVTTQAVVSQSLLFAGFGAFSAALTPVFDELFGIGKQAQPSSKVQIATAQAGHQHSHQPTLQPSQQTTLDIPTTALSSGFADKEMVRRNAGQSQNAQNQL